MVVVTRVRHCSPTGSIWLSKYCLLGSYFVWELSVLRHCHYSWRWTRFLHVTVHAKCIHTWQCTPSLPLYLEVNTLLTCDSSCQVHTHLTVCSVTAIILGGEHASYMWQFMPSAYTLESVLRHCHYTWRWTRFLHVTVHSKCIHTWQCTPSLPWFLEVNTLLTCDSSCQVHTHLTVQQQQQTNVGEWV
jgi:hypothetical protein